MTNDYYLKNSVQFHLQVKTASRVNSVFLTVLKIVKQQSPREISWIQRTKQ